MVANQAVAGNDSKPPIYFDLKENYLSMELLKIKIDNEWKSKYGVTIVPDIPENDEEEVTGCCWNKCVNKCNIHLSHSSLINQKGEYLEPIPEQPSEEGGGASRGTSIEDMTRALLEGLKISPSSEEPRKTRDSQDKVASALDQFKKISPTMTPPPIDPVTVKLVGKAREIVSNSTEDISKSLLNLLHSSASKLRGDSEIFQTPSASAPVASGVSPMTPNVLNFFSAAAASSATTPQQLTGQGISLSTVESNIKKQISSPPRTDFSLIRVPLRVFIPFNGATPLCGLELKIDNLGYRVIRVTEKPGQDGNIREGDIITAIDGEALTSPSVSTDDREKHIRLNFGKKLKDGVIVTIQRPSFVNNADLHPDPNTVVERRLDFGLMLLGAGIDWKSLVGKLPMAVQQAKVVCQSFGIEGKLESIPSVDDPNSSPLLTLKGPAGLVDKAMRQFCVVIVKGALLQQQQQHVLGAQS
jgi:hypothetical protein